MSGRSERQVALCTRFLDGVLFFSPCAGFWTADEQWPLRGPPLICVCDEDLNISVPPNSDVSTMKTFLLLSGAIDGYYVRTDEHSSRQEACMALELNMSKLQRFRTCLPFCHTFINEVGPEVLEKLSAEVDAVANFTEPVSDATEFAKLLRNLRKFTIDMRTFETYSFSKDTFLNTASSEGRMVYADYVLPFFIENCSADSRNYVTDALVREIAAALSDSVHISTLLKLVEDDLPDMSEKHCQEILEMILGRLARENA